MEDHVRSYVHPMWRNLQSWKRNMFNKSILKTWWLCFKVIGQHPLWKILKLDSSILLNECLSNLKQESSVHKWPESPSPDFANSCHLQFFVKLLPSCTEEGEHLSRLLRLCKIFLIPLTQVFLWSFKRVNLDNLLISLSTLN